MDIINITHAILMCAQPTKPLLSTEILKIVKIIKENGSKNDVLERNVSARSPWMRKRDSNLRWEGFTKRWVLIMG